MNSIYLIANSDDIYVCEEVTFRENLLKYISELKTLIPGHEFKLQLLLILERDQFYIDLGSNSF